MKTKKIFIAAASLAMVAVCVAGVTFGWFAFIRSSITLTGGDVRISVSHARYAIAEGNTVPQEVDFQPLESSNQFNEISTNEYIALRFTVTNETENDAMLFLRTGDFTSNIFECFGDYTVAARTNGVTIGSDGSLSGYTGWETTEGGESGLADRISEQATINTAKLTLVFENISYTTSGGGETYIMQTGSTDSMYLWNYATGKNRFVSENSVWATASNPAVVAYTGGISLAANSSITLSFDLHNRQSTNSIDAYGNWLLGGSGDSTGYGHDRCAEMLGYTYEATAASDRAIIGGYLNNFFNCEKEAINPTNELLSVLSIDIEYFEFIAESTGT